ncbi:MAG TPA: RNA 2',3'-cyclic phosphodiesterase [Anaerolineae bacterium]|nr:RNA 2',3'-cyclic phosphodiesterase [Anaerolineae bacterium]
MSTYRLFIAINLPPELLVTLQTAQRRLQRQLAAFPLRWSRPEGIHLTLKFLGETETTRIDAITEALARVAARHTAFELPVGGLGMFPNARRPHVLWVGVEDEARRLQKLARDVDRAMAQLGWPREKRPFNGHLTLARVKKQAEGRARRELGELVLNLRGYEKLGILPVHTIYLMRSHLHPDGAIYTELHRIALGNPNA